MNYGYDAIPFIDTRDIAACAAVALTRPGHDGQYGVGPVSVPPTDHYWHRPLVVVGGSYIGLEFGQMFGDSDLKSRSSKWHRVSSSARTQKSRRLCRRSCRTKVTVRLNARRLRVSGEASSIVAHVDCEEGSPSIKGSHLLLAVGRRPNTDDLGLDAAGVSRDDRGYIVVNDQLETNVSGIWALGDCNRRGAFTHTAYNDFEIVASNLLDGTARRVSDRISAYALFIDPPLGRVGLTETEA